MTPFEAFQLYVAIRNHFTLKSYNYFKYNGKVRANYQTFNKRKDRYLFEKLAKHKDPKGYLVANLIENQSFHLSLADGDHIYTNWRSRIESLTYIISLDLDPFDAVTFKQAFEVLNNQHPEILQRYLYQKITLETFVVLIDVIRCKRYFDIQLKDDVVWEHVGILVTKYRPFLEYDRSKIIELLKKKSLV